MTMTPVEAAPVPELVYRLADGNVVTIPDGQPVPDGAVELRAVAPSAKKVETVKVWRLGDGSVVTTSGDSGPPSAGATELIDPTAVPVNAADRKSFQWPLPAVEATSGRFVPGDPNAVDPLARGDRHVADPAAPEDRQAVATQWRQAKRHDGHQILVGPGETAPDGYELLPPVAAP